MPRLQHAYNIDDLARMARRSLPSSLYDYVVRGAEDEVTMRANAELIKQIYIRQKVGVDVSRVDTSVDLFGVKCAMPVGIGVTAMSGMLAYDGERSLARAAKEACIPYVLGTTNFSHPAELRAVCGDLLWRQVYPFKRRELFTHQVDQARTAGIRVLVITMDSPVNPNREYTHRSGLTLAGPTVRAWAGMLAAPRWLFGTLARYVLKGGLPDMAHMPAGETRFYKGSGSWSGLTGDFTWNEIRTLRRQWSDVLVVKGLSSATDARTAAACGVDGIIVSNHGGRSLDGCVPSILALPEIVDAVAPKVTVMVDGGFRRGADILKAIAIGASAVFVGRAPLFGLAAAGEAGVTRALTILREEMGRASALAGWARVSDAVRGDLVRVGAGCGAIGTAV